MKALTFLALVSLAVIAGCKQNPFPTAGEILTERPKERPPILPPLVLDIPDTIEFREGEANEALIKAKVPAPATPIITVTDLPEGATFDSSTMKLNWTPNFAAGNEPNDPTARFRSYVVSFTLRSSADVVTSVSRRALITVRDVPQAVDINVPTGDRELTEGKEFSETVTIGSADFPRGPFTLNITNLPQAAKVEAVQGDPTKWTIRYTPDLRTVTVADQQSGNNHFKYIDVRYTAVLPSGLAVNKVSKWKVADARKFASVSAPTKVIQATDINFSLVAEDINGETLSVGGSTHPIITLMNGSAEVLPTDEQGGDGDIDPETGARLPDYELFGETGYPGGHPSGHFGRFGSFPPGFNQKADEARESVNPPGTPFGKLTMTIDKNDLTQGTVNPVTIAAVRWNQIPADKVGTEAKLKFRTCVNRYRWAKDHCSFQEVAVKFDAEKKPAPVIDRSKWPLAQLRYVRQNEAFTIALKVADGEAGGPVPNVQIFPVSARTEVKWANHQLTITPTVAGIKQFNVVATSTFGVTQAESFLYETLPWSWSKVLILGESASDPEVKKTLELFEDPQLANPALQPLDEKLLALRTTLVIGTKSLGERSILPELERAAGKIPNVILMTPLLGSLAGTLKDEIASLKLTLDKRFLDITGIPALKDFEVRIAPDSLLTIPSNTIRLGEKLTNESKSPLTLKIETGSTCKARLNLTHSQVPAPLLAAATCRRANGGILVLSGFEWGDLETSLPDARIAKKWMSEVEKP